MAVVVPVNESLSGLLRGAPLADLQMEKLRAWAGQWKDGEFCKAIAAMHRELDSAFAASEAADLVRLMSLSPHGGLQSVATIPTTSASVVSSGALPSTLPIGDGPPVSSLVPLRYYGSETSIYLAEVIALLLEIYSFCVSNRLSSGMDRMASVSNTTCDAKRCESLYDVKRWTTTTCRLQDRVAGMRLCDQLLRGAASATPNQRIAAVRSIVGDFLLRTVTVADDAAIAVAVAEPPARDQKFLSRAGLATFCEALLAP
jgi:hypothetical protein